MKAILFGALSVKGLQGVRFGGNKGAIYSLAIAHHLPSQLFIVDQACKRIRALLTVDKRFDQQRYNPCNI